MAMQNTMPMTISRLKPKPEVKCEYNKRTFVRPFSHLPGLS